MSRRPIRAAGGLCAAIVAWPAIALTALAASPVPSAVAGGDPRSAGQGPGLVGDPAFALLAVAAIGIGSLLATLVYVRLTANRGD